MDYFLLLRFTCLPEPIEGRCIETLETELMKPEATPNQPVDRKIYGSLSFGDNFKTAVSHITRQINDLALTFINVKLVSDDMGLFTKVLPQEFKVRGISMPFVWSNYVDWPAICKGKYRWPGGMIVDASK